MPLSSNRDAYLGHILRLAAIGAEKAFHAFKKLKTTHVVFALLKGMDHKYRNGVALGYLILHLSASGLIYAVQGNITSTEY
jgi:hypothetical protein